MYTVWLWGTVTRLMQFAGAKVPGWVIILFVTIFPLQGFFNMIVYFFPRICRYCERGTSVFRSFRSTVGGGLRSSVFSSGLGRSSTNVDGAESTVEPVERAEHCTRDDPFSQEESGVMSEKTVVFSDSTKAGQSSDSPDAVEKLELNDVSAAESEEDAIDELAHIVEA